MKNAQPQTRQRVTNEQIVQAYRETGSVWKAGKVLGIVGQSVWERLRGIGYEMPSRKWTREEIVELTALAPTCTISEIANRLGRPYFGVAIKLSRFGLAHQVGKRRRFLKPTHGGIGKKVALDYAGLLPQFRGSLRQFAQQNGVSLSSLTSGLQQHTPETWAAILTARGMAEKTCPVCTRRFLPFTKKQERCSAKCTRDANADRTYFGGKRANTIGLAEGTCQVCSREVKKGLSSHHVLGKENDPDNDVLIALCQGCHQLVGKLGRMPSVADHPEAWEALVCLALMRRHGAKRPVGYHVIVEWDELTEAELKEMEDVT